MFTISNGRNKLGFYGGAHGPMISRVARLLGFPIKLESWSELLYNASDCDRRTACRRDERSYPTYISSFTVPSDLSWDGSRYLQHRPIPAQGDLSKLPNQQSRFIRQAIHYFAFLIMNLLRELVTGYPHSQVPITR